MKLAQALSERKACVQKLAELQNRMARNIFVEEGRESTEKPNDLLGEYGQVRGRLVELITGINRANTRTTLANGRTIMECIAERDVLKIEMAFLDSILNGAGQLTQRNRGTEIRHILNIEVGPIQKKRDKLAQYYRELDGLIQAANWSTDI